MTARTCANLIGYNPNLLINPIDFRVGCDCIQPFALNFKGYCIPEDECNEYEAFGAVYDTSNEMPIEFDEFAPIPLKQQAINLAIRNDGISFRQELP